LPNRYWHLHLPKAARSGRSHRSVKTSWGERFTSKFAKIFID
jgi:hypothetical protein